MDWPIPFFAGLLLGGGFGFMLGYIVYDDGR
jgi:hypothetical protein